VSSVPFPSSSWESVDLRISQVGLITDKLEVGLTTVSEEM
jgi:hypothetical protein